MPLYNYACECGATKQRVCSFSQSKDVVACPKCPLTMRRAPKPPTSTVSERLDNGWMARAVERPADAERLYADRANKDPSKD